MDEGEYRAGKQHGKITVRYKIDKDKLICSNYKYDENEIVEFKKV